MANKNGSVLGIFNTTTPNTASGIWNLPDVLTNINGLAWPGVVIPGGQGYNIPGTYTWVAPTNVTSISVVAISGGAAGLYGGGGGGLGYKNNISVTPGASYTVVVGAGANGTTAYPGNAGGASYITVGGTNYGANAGSGSYSAGTPLNSDGGGNGGTQPGYGSGAGGGAGGYTGSGGDGAFPGNGNTTGYVGAGGGGGGGAQQTTGSIGGAGGGSSLYGGNGGRGGTSVSTQGALGGTGPVSSNPAGGDAIETFGGHYGGGAVGITNSKAGGGAVRIIWPGTTRQFPSTNINIINETQLTNPAPPVNTSLPTISGTATIGQTLTVTTGTWTGSPTPTYSYQWQRGTTNISGATNSTYTIVSADGGSTIRCVVTATNFIAAITATTSNTSTVPAAGQTVVTSGLTVYLDAGNPSSYPGSGSTWFDLSGNGNHMSLINSPSYSSSSGGVIQFNGSNQYADLNLNYSTSSFTIMGAARYSGATRGRIITAINNNWLLGHWASSTQKYYAEGWITNSNSGETNDTNWRIYSATENYSSDLRSMYVNNVAYVTNSTGGSQGFNGLRLGQQYSEYSTSEVGFILVYNRILTEAEMTQNYSFFASRYGLGIVTSGLILNLDPGNTNSYPGSGTTVTDLSGNGYNGTLVNGVGFNSGNFGYFTFDNSNDYISTTGMANYSYSNGITVSFWHYNGGSTNYRGVINNGVSGDRLGGFDMRYGRENYFGGTDNGTALYCGIVNTGGTRTVGAINANVNEWHNYVMTYNNTTISLYKDGSLFSSVTHGGGGQLKSTSGSTMIGQSIGSSEFLDGRLSQVLIYNRPLSLAEVQQNFNAVKNRFGL